MKLILLVEGETEAKALPEFCRRWLESLKLRSRLGIDPIRLDGAGNFWNETPRLAVSLLASPGHGEIAAVLK